MDGKGTRYGTPEATTKSLLEVPSIGGAYERSPQTVSGTPAKHVLSRKLSCESAISEEFQLDGNFRGFRSLLRLMFQWLSVGTSRRDRFSPL